MMKDNHPSCSSQVLADIKSRGPPYSHSVRRGSGGSEEDSNPYPIDSDAYHLQLHAPLPQPQPRNDRHAGIHHHVYYDDSSSRNEDVQQKTQSMGTASLYKRRYYVMSSVTAPRNDPEELRPAKKRPRLSALPRSAADTILAAASFTSPSRVAQVTIQSLQTALSYVFTKVHHRSTQHKDTEAHLPTSSMLNSHIQYLHPAPIGDRVSLLAECCELFNAMDRRLADRKVSRQILLSPLYSQYSLSHALLDLYSLLWHSPSLSMANQQDELVTHHSSHRHLPHALLRRIPPQHSYSDENTSSPPECFSLASNCLTPTALAAAIAQVKIRLFLWYIKHYRPVPASRSADQVLRSLEFFDFRSNHPVSVPPVVFQETSNHLARLLLLCNFDEFFHILYLFGKTDNSAAQILADIMLKSSSPVKSPTSYRSDLLNPSKHERVLFCLRSAVESALPSESLRLTLENSVFAKCIELLSGDEAKIDKIIFDVFPNCCLASFILGLFWRSFSDSISLDALCQAFQGDELGELVAFLFSSWLHHHVSLTDLQSKFDVQPCVISLLAGDVEQTARHLQRQYPTLLIAPILVDYLSFDHHFTNERRIKTAVYFKHAAYLSSLGLSSIATPYVLQGLQEGQYESCANKFYGQNDRERQEPQSVNWTKGTSKRRAGTKRFGLDDEDQDEKENVIERQKGEWEDSSQDDRIDGRTEGSLESLEEMSRELLRLVREDRESLTDVTLGSCRAEEKENEGDKQQGEVGTSNAGTTPASMGDGTTKVHKDTTGVMMERLATSMERRPDGEFWPDFKFSFRLDFEAQSARLMSLSLLVHSMRSLDVQDRNALEHFMSLLDLFDAVTVYDDLAELIELNRILEGLIERHVTEQKLNGMTVTRLISSLRFSFLFAHVRLQGMLLMEGEAVGVENVLQLMDHLKTHEEDEALDLLNRHSPTQHPSGSETFPWLGSSWRSWIGRWMSAHTQSRELRSDASYLIEKVIDDAGAASESVLLSTLGNAENRNLLFNEFATSVYSTRLAFLLQFAVYEDAVKILSSELSVDEMSEPLLIPLKKIQPPQHILNCVKPAAEWLIKLTCACLVPVPYFERVLNFLLAVVLSSPPIVDPTLLEQLRLFWSEYRSGTLQLYVSPKSVWSPFAKDRPRCMTQALSNLRLQTELLSAPPIVSPSSCRQQHMSSVESWVENVIVEERRRR